MNNSSPLEAVFFAALEKGSSQERATYLDAACVGDPDLRRRVEKMLAAQAQAASFLEQPAHNPIVAIREERVSEGPGTVIGQYKLLEQIGEGGFGVVFMAEQTEPVRRKVALKVVKPGMDTRQVVARFEAERQALALMDHPNIAHVFDGGATDTGRPYFVMELVRGIPITDFCDENQLSVRERLGLFISVCQAVQHAHTKGIIHRDLKPTNVLVTLHDDVPVVKIIDFGIAKATGQQLTEKTLFTNFAHMLGTPMYMSPEQARMSGLDVDTRTDIYSLGVLLYELLTGTTPFDKERLRTAAYDEIRRIIREEEPARPSTRISMLGKAASTMSANRRSDPKQLSQLCRGEVDWIVMKALDKDRNRRYETASVFAADVQRYLDDEPVQACPPSAMYRFRKFARRNKAALVTAGLVVLALLAGTAISTWQAVRATVAEAKTRDALGQAEEAEKIAAQEAAIARAVNDFLQKDLLGQAAVHNQPGGGPGRDPKVDVRTLLDRAAKNIERRFPDQPLTEAAVRLTLGETYTQLGEFDEAQSHLERAVQLRAAQLGADHADTLAAKNSLAVLLVYQRKYERAELLVREVLQARIARLGVDHPDTLKTKNGLGLVYRDQARPDVAEPIFREVLQGRLARLGADHPDTLISKNNLALVYHDQGKHDQAEPLYQEVLRRRLSTLGADHPSTLISMTNVAGLHRDRGDHDRAEPLYLEVLQARTATLGPDHPRTLNTKNDLARMYLDQGRYDRAEPLYREAADGARRKLGLAHLSTQQLIANLVGCYERMGEPARGEPLCRELADFCKQQAGAGSLPYAQQLAMLGQNLLAQQKPADAELVLHECLAIRAKTEPEAWTTFEAKSLLGGALLGRKRYADAEPLLVQGYAGLKRRAAQIPNDAKPRLSEALDRLVRLYDDWGKKDEAARWRKERQTPANTTSTPKNPDADEEGRPD
jgi:serine/threonine protein kinase/tetratricopeptide (TPR) repeat protein